ncbi:hypothetical protein DL764_005786 [Monosporascus ibericus]|uniref:Uncharacterized protein n=1 Tax=Monosporascus ibericus TaxID=155417 RepID=A0A4Q4T9Q3_9PEZI|nr:hypothetical protein DL764_005786 [Monosporascus ibericus]
MPRSQSRADPVPPPAEWLTQLSGDIEHRAGSISIHLRQVSYLQIEMKAQMDRVATAVGTLGGQGSLLPSESILRIANEIARSMQSLEVAIENFKGRHQDILGSLAVLSYALGPCVQRAWEAEEGRDRPAT